MVDCPNCGCPCEIGIKICPSCGFQIDSYSLDDLNKEESVLERNPNMIHRKHIIGSYLLHIPAILFGFFI